MTSRTTREEKETCARGRKEDDLALKREMILTYHKKYPHLQPFQLKRQLKRLEGRRVSVKAITRVLKEDEKARLGTRSEVEVCDVAS